MFPPRPSMRLVRDTIAFCAAEMPRWHPVSISGYHIREAGSTAAQELAFTLANGFAYVELAQARRARRRRVRAAAQLLLQRPHRLLRGDRQVPRRPAHLGPLDARPLRRDRASARCTLRFHTQTAGVSLTAQQPELNIARTAIEALAGVLGGTQSLHTNSMDEALALPTEQGGAHRAAHPADHRPRDRRGQRGRPARRLVVRRGAHRRDRAAGRGDLRPPRRAGRRLDARRRATPGIDERLVPGRDRRRGVRLRAEGQRAASASSSASTASPRATTTTTSTSSRSPPSRSSRRSSGCRRCKADRDGEAVARRARPAARRGGRSRARTSCRR